MCGIFGFATLQMAQGGSASASTAIDKLFLISESRGREAAGLAMANDELLGVYKDSIAASAMIRDANYRREIKGWLDQSLAKGRFAAIGHSRLVTNGLQGIAANNQPVTRGNTTVIHNGIIVNDRALWAQNPDIKPLAEVDTEVIAALLDREVGRGVALEQAVKDVLSKLIGEVSIASLFRNLDAMVLATNTGSLYYAINQAGTSFVFASEGHMVHQFLESEAAAPYFAKTDEVRQLRACHGAVLQLSTLTLIEFPLATELAAPSVSVNMAAMRRVEDIALRDEAARAALRRCTCCLLPETMPFITFDHEGVCNYCHAYKKVGYGKISDLEATLDRFRSRDGSPDCVVAFSGGRDSSYGLHLLKTKFNMNPIAYTYDWGMVTDLARRNQARMCGKLGVEHIWVSANIREKRENIRRNVEAWLKRPHLGIIPLFMAGDKQFFYYANKMMKNTKIDLMVFCTNRLEKTDFKTGFMGLEPESVMLNKPSTMAMGNKLKMLSYYGKQFATNPRYLNRSLADTAFAYMSYYLIKQDHLFLFDYHTWDEDTINQVLIDNYDWELATDTETTWRIGDGTAPFYNYIYHTVAGFSEHDTFRSNQIREGVLSRDEAWKIVQRDNQPRWASIREYLQLIGVNFDDAMRAINAIPKLYRV
jgi:asparagine synthetase B (glutamine-hydrolysing)